MGLAASRLDIFESMTTQWQGQGDKEGRKGMNNGYLYHGGQWDLHRSRLAGSVDCRRRASVCEL